MTRFSMMNRRTALAANPGPTLTQEVADQAKMIGKYLLVDFRDIPSRQVGMDSIHEGRIISHFLGHWPEQVAYSLLVFNIDIEVTNEYHASIRPDAFLAATKFAGLHVALHNVDAVLLVK